TWPTPVSGASGHCPQRTANRPGSQRYLAGRRAADGDRPRSGGVSKMRRRVGLCGRAGLLTQSLDLGKPEDGLVEKPLCLVQIRVYLVNPGCAPEKVATGL